jgi:hypothetical protein
MDVIEATPLALGVLIALGSKKIILQAMNEIAAAGREGTRGRIYRTIVDPNLPKDLSKLTARRSGN